MTEPLEGRSCHVLLLSAATAAALRDHASRVQGALQNPTALDRDLGAFCAAESRPEAGPHRLAVVAKDATVLRDKLSAFAQGTPTDVLQGEVTAPKTPPRVAFLFSGQGAQYAGMGTELYRTNHVFRAALDACAAGLVEGMDAPLLPLLAATDGRLDQTQYTQPTLFAVEYALARLWQSWGIAPDVLVGHSVGEYAAAAVAGILRLPDALNLIAARGRLMQELPPGGGMLAVLAGHDEVRRSIEPFADLDIAGFNAPLNTVVAGPLPSLATLQAELAARGVGVRPLVVSHAFHSRLMDPMVDAFAARAASVTFHPSTIPLMGNVDAAPVAVGQTLSADYLRRHVRQPVLFAQSLVHLADCSAFVECGPTAVLLPLATACLPQTTALWLPSLSRKRSAWAQMLQSVGQLYTAGFSFEWNKVLAA